MRESECEDVCERVCGCEREWDVCERVRMCETVCVRMCERECLCVGMCM